jgi:hypothetical protein
MIRSPFRYEKLHRALKKSHENEKRLIKKCRELNQEIVQNAAKVQTALRLSTEDRNNLALLKREIEKVGLCRSVVHNNIRMTALHSVSGVFSSLYHTFICNVLVLAFLFYHPLFHLASTFYIPVHR